MSVRVVNSTEENEAAGVWGEGTNDDLQSQGKTGTDFRADIVVQAEGDEWDDIEGIESLINPDNLEEVNILLKSQRREAVEFPLNAEERTRVINALRQVSGAGDLSVDAAHRLIGDVRRISQGTGSCRQKQLEVLDLLSDVYYDCQVDGVRLKSNFLS